MTDIEFSTVLCDTFLLYFHVKQNSNGFSHKELLEKVHYLEEQLEFTSVRNARLESHFDEMHKGGPLTDDTKSFDLETQLKQSQHELHLQKLKMAKIENDQKSAQQRAVELSLEINVMQKRVRELEATNERAEREKKYQKQELTAASSKVWNGYFSNLLFPLSNYLW